MDGKYGRLFTKDDVRLLLVFAELWHKDGVEGLEPPRDFREAEKWIDRIVALTEDRTREKPETDHRLTFPADEPLILLRASEQRGETEEALAEFAAWRLEHFGSADVRVPD